MKKYKLLIISSLILVILLGSCSSDTETYKLNLDTEGNGNIIQNPDEEYYTKNTTVELTANPDTDWKFEHWEGSGFDGNTDKTIKINMDDDYNLIAVFNELQPAEVNYIEGQITGYLDTYFIGGYTYYSRSYEISLDFDNIGDYSKEITAKIYTNDGLFKELNIEVPKDKDNYNFNFETETSSSSDYHENEYTEFEIEFIGVENVDERISISFEGFFAPE